MQTLSKVYFMFRCKFSIVALEKYSNYKEFFIQIIDNVA